jgi:hypothetical protein
MSTVRANQIQIGQSATVTDNGTWYQPTGGDGTIRYAIGPSTAKQFDALTINGSGKIDVARSLTVGQNATVSGNTSISGSVGIGTTTPGTKVDAYASGTTATIIRARNDTTTVYLDADNAYSYLNTYTNHPMLFGTNNIERMRINTSGHVTMPYQPCFYAYRSSNWLTIPGVVILDQTTVNVGGHYSTSTGRFTAPVAGTYQFTLYTLAYTTTNNYNDNWLRKNGTAVVGSWLRTWYGSTTGAVASMSTYMTLAVNDYIDFYVNTGPALYSDGNGWIRFGGHLIG